MAKLPGLLNAPVGGNRGVDCFVMMGSVELREGQHPGSTWRSSPVHDSPCSPDACQTEQSYVSFGCSVQSLGPDQQWLAYRTGLLNIVVFVVCFTCRNRPHRPARPVRCWPFCPVASRHLRGLEKQGIQSERRAERMNPQPCARLALTASLSGYRPLSARLSNQEMRGRNAQARQLSCQCCSVPDLLIAALMLQQV
jgi:hypothetical protein